MMIPFSLKYRGKKPPTCQTEPTRVCLRTCKIPQHADPYNSLFCHSVTSTSLRQITNTKLRNYLIIAHFASECCSHPLPTTEHFKRTTELFIAVISVHYANHLVLGTYLTGLTTAKLLQNTMIMDIQGSNTVFSKEKW